MEKQTLLQKAKQVKSNKKSNKILGDEEYELGLAWARGEVSYRQIHTVMEYKNINSVYGLLAKSFERYVAEKEGK